MFNQNKYKQEYNKEHYKTFKVDLRIEEMEKLEEYLKKIDLTKAQFLRYCIVRFVSEYEDKFRTSLNEKQ